MAIAPTLPPGTSVGVTVAGPGGTSNALSFLYVALGSSGSTGATGATGSVGSTGGSPTGSTSSGGGLAVTYAASWNIVGGPTGTMVNGAMGPLYTYQAGDTAYETIANGSPLTQPQGYWAYFSSTMGGSIPASGPQTLTVTLPPGQWVMISDPGNTPATVSGADVVYTYSASSGYQPTTTLQPGQGGWAISVLGGTATIVNS
jgi:hypothetical protein